MLKDNFYTIEEMKDGGSSLLATLRWRADHPIYEGHFPGQPVVPGACLLQCVKEMMEIATGNSLLLSKAGLIKFLRPLDPRQTAAIRVEIKYAAGEDGKLTVNATLYEGTNSCFKFTGLFQAAASR